MRDSERAMIIEHIMDATMPNNLATALDTADVIYDGKKQVVVAGAEALVAHVTTSDPTADLRCVEDSLRKDPMRSGVRLEFRYEHWPLGHTVGIFADGGNASKVFIGVTGRGPLEERLQRLLNEYHAGGSGTEHWPWWYWLAPPFNQLTSKEAVLRLHSGEAAKELAAQIRDVVAIVDTFYGEARSTGAH